VRATETRCDEPILETRGRRVEIERRDWASPEDLTHYIVDRHHRYIREMAPVISASLAELRGRHAARHPELEAVSDAFEALRADLAMQMLREEHILFPYITALARAARTGDGPVAAPLGTVRHSVRVMTDDHRLAAMLMARIRVVTNDFRAPDDGCRAHTRCLAELAEFERDLHRHLYLEDHVLFPGAIALEDRAA
jgi:regulator of cell morphogenesis and NO signaling